jgi:hypothetical protein
MLSWVLLGHHNAVGRRGQSACEGHAANGANNNATDKVEIRKKPHERFIWRAPATNEKPMGIVFN